MTTIPSITPQSRPQPEGLAWPTSQWPTGSLSNAEAVVAVASRAFDEAALSDTHAVVIIRDGRLVYERYAGALTFFDREPESIDAGTTLISWSMAKSMIHFLVGILVDEGRMNPFEATRISEWANDERSAITLENLLAMRDGLDFVEDYLPDRPSDVIEMLFGTGQDDVAGYTIARPLAHQPGTHFNYSSGTTNIISSLVARHVGFGEPYRQFIQERLFDPLGMRSATAKFDDAGVFIGSSYVYATPRDFAKFGYLYLRGGEWDGHQLVSPQWVASAQVPHSVDAESGRFYSWQWWVTGDRYGTYWANGYEGQSISVVPTLDAVVVRLGKTDAERYPDLYQWRADLLDELACGSVIAS